MNAIEKIIRGVDKGASAAWLLWVRSRRREAADETE